MRTCTRTSKRKVREFGSCLEGAATCECFLGRLMSILNTSAMSRRTSVTGLRFVSNHVSPAFQIKMEAHGVTVSVESAGRVRRAKGEDFRESCMGVYFATNRPRQRRIKTRGKR